MSLQLLKTDIETGNIRKLYYICGEESYLKHYYFSELKKTLFGEVSDHPDCLTREGAEITVSEITDAAGAYPMLAEKKAVIIIDLKMSDPVTSWITQKASELEDNIVIIIYQLTESPDFKTNAGKQFKKAVSDNGLWVEVSPLDSQTLRKWVVQQFRKRNMTIESDLVFYLLSQTSNDMYSLLNEIDKLSSYCDKTVTKQAIDIITTKTIDAKTYELTDAIFDKNPEKAFVTLKKISDMRTNEIMIMASIYSAITIIYKTKLLIETGYSNSEIELELGLKGFVLNRNISRANRIKRSSLDRMIAICAEADIASKSTSSDASVIISELIASLIETV